MNARLAIVSWCALGLLSSAGCVGDIAGVAPDRAVPDGGAPDSGADIADASPGSAPDGAPTDAAPEATCNGAAALCERRYDQVAYVTTHNAMSTQEDGFFGPNQFLGIARQLDDGVRGLMLDVHDDQGKPTLCHTSCLLGKTPLVEGLGILRGFLDAHRGEVVTIIFESYVDGAAIETAFAEADLVRYVHTQPVGEPWPTLGAMIEADRRLVVLTDRPGGPAWNMDCFAHAWETHFTARTAGDFSCAPNRGDPGHPLFIFNHFLTNVLPVPGQAATTNGDPLLGDRAAECQRASGRLPNFVTVDFYSVGVVREVVAHLNGLD